MKKRIPLLVFILITLGITSCKSNAVFDTDAKVKVLYRDINNEVYIRNPDIHKIKFTSDKADISILNDTTLVVNTKAKWYLKIKMEYEGTTRTMAFRVQEIPNARLCFRGRVYETNKPMPVNEARTTHNAQIAIQDFPYDCLPEIISMDILHIRDKQVLYSFTTVGRELNGALQRAQVGDTYVFYNIRLKLTGGGEFKGEDTVLKIVEAEK